MTGGRLVAAADAGLQALSPDPAGSARFRAGQPPRVRPREVVPVCQVSGLTGDVNSRGAGCFGEVGLAVLGLILDRWDESDLAV